MNLKELLNDDRAVSPVIGVILMVAITVILAAVIGTFVLGLGDQVSQTTPNASFGFDYDRNNSGDDKLTVSHNGGDTLEASEVNVTISGGTNVGSGNNSLSWATHESVDEVSAGSTLTLDGAISSGDLGLNEATIRVVWQSSEGDSSAQIGRWDGPDA